MQEYNVPTTWFGTKWRMSVQTKDCNIGFPFRFEHLVGWDIGDVSKKFCDAYYILLKDVGDYLFLLNVLTWVWTPKQGSVG